MRKKKKKPIVRQAKYHVKKNDLVVVLSGNHCGERGKILQVLPKQNRVIVEGVRLIKKTKRPTQNDPQGGFLEREAPLPISKVMLADRYDSRRSSFASSEEKEKKAPKNKK